MADMRPIGKRLKQSRKRSALTQKQVAQQLGVPRELISMWETEIRCPSAEYLEGLAQLYQTSVAYLTGVEEKDYGDRAVLLRREPEHASAHSGLTRWLDFLAAWAEQLARWNDELPGPWKPPHQLDHGPALTDARRAPTLADEVRDYYRLGRNALPNLQAFLDERGILVCRIPLGKLTEGGIAGAFLNHSRLGFCILVNAVARPGRQAFAMAHAYAHGLYHYARRGIICESGADNAVERFADTFAAHFLVPRKKLRQVVSSIDEQVEAYHVVYIASYFRVSYATTLKRLLSERHITREVYERMRQYSPAALAQQVGLNARHFSATRSEALGLDRYPVSVLERIRCAIDKNQLTPVRAASLLRVEEEAIRKTMLSEPPLATEVELREFGELPL